MKDKVPKVTVFFFASVREVFQERKNEIELKKAPNIRGLLTLLCNTSERRRKIFDECGEVKSDITILKNGRNIDFLGGIATELFEGDSISIFPPVYGG